MLKGKVPFLSNANAEAGSPGFQFSKTQYDLNACFYCDEIHCSPTFVGRCAGANRRTAGVVTDVARSVRPTGKITTGIFNSTEFPGGVLLPPYGMFSTPSVSARSPQRALALPFCADSCEHSIIFDVRRRLSAGQGKRFAGLQPAGGLSMGSVDAFYA